MYDIGISEIAVTAKYEDTEDTEDILKKNFINFLRDSCHFESSFVYNHRVIVKRKPWRQRYEADR